MVCRRYAAGSAVEFTLWLKREPRLLWRASSLWRQQHALIVCALYPLARYVEVPALTLYARELAA